MVVDWGECVVREQDLILVWARAKTFRSVQILLHARINTNAERLRPRRQPSA